MTDNNKIEILSDLEHVQARPSMYLGTLYDATQLLVEILDNALDELANGFTDEVRVNVNDDHVVTISDRGRGIPIHSVMMNGVETDSIVAAATKLFSGGKFENSTANYKISIGLHGVGLVAVNALCEYTVVQVAKGDSVYTYNFLNGKYTDKQERPRKEEDPSTLVMFKPISKYFNKMGYNLHLIQQRLYLITSHVSGSKVYLNDELIPSIPMLDLARSYLDVDPSHPIFEVKVSQDPEQARVFMTYDDTRKVVGDVNLNICTGGYITAFENIFHRVVMDKYPNLSKTNILSNFKFYCSLTIKDPRFNAQTKQQMVKDVRPLLRGLIPHIEQTINLPFFKEYLTELSEAKSLNSASRKLKRKTIVSVENPLQDCRNRPGDILYILEGDSAGGTLKKFRDKDTEAIFPLSGKILNTINKSIDDALSSNKVKFLLEAIGIDPSGRRKDFRYNQLKVIADGDADGGHICVLVLLAIWKYAKHIIEEGCLSVIMPPLYGTRIKNEFIPIYSQEEADMYKSQNYEVSRFKGLGEMDACDLEAVIRGNAREYVIQAPGSKQVENAIKLIVTDTAVKRVLCNDLEKYNLERVIQAATLQNNQTIEEIKHGN